MPRISVIIPAHNAERYLPETLKSIFDQTFTDWEIVAVDDGSSDGTRAILEAAGPRIRSFRNPDPRGPAAARNLALAHASGEHAVFVDADDLLLPAYMERQLACLETSQREGRDVGIVSCDAVLLEGGEIARHTYLDTIKNADRPLNLERVLRRNPIYVSALVPMAVGSSVGWFDEELFGTEDFGLWLKILEQGFEAVLNPEPLAVYRRNAGSVSSNIARQGLNNRRAYELALARGQLSRRQRRIARKAIRYNRAMQTVATIRFGGGHITLRQLTRSAPLLAWVALTNPHWWLQWVTILRTQRQPAVSSRTAPRASSKP